MTIESAPPSKPDTAAAKPALICRSGELLINSLKRLSYRTGAGIAQLVEQLICNQQVVGSNPTAGSTQFWIADLLGRNRFTEAQPPCS